ncbi:hypothetical protein ASPCAL12845 [Aspergillus calidoustus]|uniref:Uncharacterized protein n=1 Tax=Aspergillus calidoustus TaxID=454130 RepID=A0A0U5GDF0_ASPCI|nr:hypothetical protein ASPCAL12845 [Aspergillus calidoustus]
MEGASGADPMDVTEKKRLQTRVVQQKYRKLFTVRYPPLRLCLHLQSFKAVGKRLKERIRELEELKKHIGDFSELKDQVDAAYSPPSTNIQTEAYATETTSVGLVPDQEIGAPESDHSLGALKCLPISPAQSNNHLGVSPSSALDFLSSTFENLDYSSSSLSSESQPHVGPCACVAPQWPCALFASSPRASSSSAPHQATRDNQFTVSPEDHPSQGASCQERFIHILNSIHHAGYESIEKSKFAAFSNLDGLPK